MFKSTAKASRQWPLLQVMKNRQDIEKKRGRGWSTGGASRKGLNSVYIWLTEEYAQHHWTVMNMVSYKFVIT